MNVRWASLRIADHRLPPLSAIDGLVSDLVSPVEILVASLLLASGFAIGVYTAGVIRRVVGGYILGRRQRNLHLSDAFITEFAPEGWDPTQIRREPASRNLASEEEHVIRQLVANEGRMQQTDLIAKTGWSQAKMSRLLQEMEANGDVSRIPVGRHNLILLGSFPGIAHEE